MAAPVSASLGHPPADDSGVSANQHPPRRLARIADPLSVASPAWRRGVPDRHGRCWPSGIMNPSVAAAPRGALARASRRARLPAPPRAARSAPRASRRAFWRLMSLRAAELDARAACRTSRSSLTGGEVQSPAAWSQIGFLLAYPFWYRALWLLRQPALEESRARASGGAGRSSSRSSRCCSSIVVGDSSGSSRLPAVENIAQPCPWPWTCSCWPPSTTRSAAPP